MFLLGIFDFYHLDELTVSSETDWWAVFVTAILSGGVAWIAAFIQNKYVLWNQYKSVLEKNAIKLSMLKGEAYEATKVIKTHIQFLLESARKMRYDRPFDLAFQSLNLSSFESILSLNSIDIYELSLFSGTNPKSRIFMDFFSSVKSFKNNYNQQVDIYFKKIEERNSIVSRIHNDLMEFSIPIQEAIFSEDTRRLMKKINESDPATKRQIIADYPYILLINAADKILHQFNESRDAEYKKTELYCSRLLKLIRANVDISIFEVKTVQAISNTIGNIKSLKRFYSTFRETYRGYIKSHQQNLKKLEEWSEVNHKTPKKVCFLRFLFSNKSDHQ